MKRYSYYIQYLDDPIEFAEIISEVSGNVRHKIFKTISNFCKYLDLRYGLETHTYWLSLRKKLGFKWAGEYQKGVSVSLEEAVKAIELAIEESKAVAIRIWFLAVSGSRPIYLKFMSWNNIANINNYYYVYIGREKSTKRAYIAALTPNLYKVLMKFKERGKHTPFGVSRDHEYKALKRIREVIPHFRYYALRHFNATYLLIKGLMKEEIDFLQGRAPISVLQRYYLHLDEKQILQLLLDKHNKAFREFEERILGFFEQA